MTGYRKDYIIGLDIGSSSIKLAQFLKIQDGLRLVKVDLEEARYTKDEAGLEKEIQDLLKEMVKRLDIKNSKFIVAINCPKTSIKKLVAPYMPRGELRDAIRLAAKNYFPFPLEEALVDFEVLGEILEKGIRKYQVLVATSPKKTVDKYLSLLASVGIKPASFIPIPYALRELVQSVSPKEAETRCFLEIGMRHTEFSIFRGKGLVFSRKIPVAGNDLTKAMTEVLLSDRGRTELSWEEAEKIKRALGIPDESKSEVIAGKISTLQMMSMIRVSLEQLVSEIDRCFDYYREDREGSKIDSIVLLGGGASLKGLADFLSRELGIEVRLGNPLEGLKIESGAMQDGFSARHRLALAIGAALNSAKGLNLLPSEIKEETKRTFKRATLQAVSAGAVLLLAFLYIGMNIQLGNFNKRIAAGRMEFSSLGPQIEQVEAQRLTDEVLLDEPYWDDVFKELSNIIPADIYLTSLKMDNGVIGIKGVIVSDEREETLSNFILTLEKGIFKNVKLVTAKEMRDRSASEFELHCGVD